MPLKNPNFLPRIEYDNPVVIAKNYYSMIDYDVLLVTRVKLYVRRLKKECLLSKIR